MSVEFDPTEGTFESSGLQPSLEALCASGSQLKGRFDLYGVSSSFERVNVSKNFCLVNTALCGTIDLSALPVIISFSGMWKNRFHAPKVLRVRLSDFHYITHDKEKIVHIIDSHGSTRKFIRHLIALIIRVDEDTPGDVQKILRIF